MPMELLNISKFFQKSKDREKDYNKGDVMFFFKELLILCEKIRSVYHRTGNPSLCIVTKEEQKKIDVDSKRFGEDILEWFWTFKKGTMQKYAIKEWGSENFEEKKDIVYEKSDGVYTLKSSIKQDEERLNQIEVALRSAFVDEKVKNIFADRLEKLRNIYTNHQSKEEFWKKEEIFMYLNTYYDLLKMLMCENNLLEQKEIKDNVLAPLLQMGTIVGKKEEFKVTFQAPIVLSILNIVYDRLNDFIRLPLDEGTSEILSTKIQSVENDMYREIFLSKINQIFRYYFVLEPEGDLYQTRVPVYDRRSEEGRLEIPVINIAHTECFQGIRELRLGEKILFELKNAMDGKFEFFEEEYRIVLVGEVDKCPLEELIKYISDALKSKEVYKNMQLVKLNFIVHTYTDEENGECCGHSYEFKKYTDFSIKSQQMKELLDEGELIFFLDNCQLYDLEVEEIRDSISFKQYISIDTYEEYFKKEKNDGLNLRCKFMELYNVLVMYLWKGKFGTLKKTAKVSLMQYIKTYVNESSEKAIYIYVSDIEAFKDLNCIREEFVRIEKYNQKEIGIIRFSTTEKESLPVEAKCKKDYNRNILVFNLWQFIKHILLNHWKDMQDLYVDGEKYFLDDIYIGMDYTNWKTEIVISYCFEGADDLKKEYVRQTMEMLVEQLKNQKNPNMYQRYLKNAFVSFLYGATKSVEDLVFLHIFKDYPNLLQEYRILGENSEVKEHYNLNCKYSHKKNYWEVAEAFDRNNVNIIDQYRVLNLDDNKEPREEAGLLNKLAQACKNIGYEDSQLFKRCEKYSL